MQFVVPPDLDPHEIDRFTHTSRDRLVFLPAVTLLVFRMRLHPVGKIREIVERFAGSCLRRIELSGSQAVTHIL